MSKEQPLQHSGMNNNSKKNVSKNTEPIQILYPSKATNDQLKKKYKEGLLRERPETLFADHFKNGGISNLIFHSTHPEAWHTAIRLHYTNVIRKGISNGWKLQVPESEHAECTTINLYKTGTITVQGDVKRFAKDFNEVRDKAQLHKNAATSCASQGEQQQNDPTEEHFNEDNEPDDPTEISNLHDSLATMKEQFARLEVELVRLREDMSLPADPNDNKNKEDDHRKELAALRKEVKDLKREREESSKQLISLSEELRQLKEDHQAHSQQLLCLTEKLLHSEQGESSNRPTEASPMLCALPHAVFEQDQHPAPPPTVLPSTTTMPATPLHTEEQPEIVLLMDSNGKFLKEKKLFPKHRTRKIWCANTKAALDLLTEEQVGRPSHIIIHTGTNDLQIQGDRVATSLRQVVEKASANFPNSRVVMSTLLPRRDFHPDTINWINARLSRDCAMKPNVFLAQHPTLNLGSLFDSVHLHKKAVTTFAKKLKDVTLNRVSYTSQRASPPHHQEEHVHPTQQQHQSHWNSSKENSRSPHPRHPVNRTPKLQRSTPEQSISMAQHQQSFVDEKSSSYAQAVYRAPVPQPTNTFNNPDPTPQTSCLPASSITELKDIQQLLNRLCSHLIG